jgi:dTDP-4-amino-4,6-dideoxygalactose transaminase
MMKFLDLSSQWNEIKVDVYKNLDSFFESSAYVMGPYLEKFESNFSKWSGRKYSVGVSNGTDGLKLAIQAFEFYNTVTDVILPANGYIADILAVKSQIKGEYNISLVDHDDYFQIDLDLLTVHLDNTRHLYDNCIILPIHMYGHPTNMKRLYEISQKYNCKIIEDASHAHGAVTNGEMIGKYADMTVYSLYPGKNLGAIGDAGIVTTDSDVYNQRLKSLRNYGSSKKYYYDDVGWNHRMDPIQALFLDEKLKRLDGWNNKKQKVVEKYNSLLNGIVETPKVDSHVGLHVYHIYCIMVDDREKLQEFLASKNIPTIIHWPVPIAKSKPFGYLDGKFDTTKTDINCNRILSLPMHQYLNDSEIEHVCSSIKTFYGG